MLHFFLSSLSLHAQFKVGSTGNIGIKGSPSVYSLDIKATSYGIKLDFSSSKDLLFDSYYEHPVIMPANSNYGYLGKSSSYFYYSYITHMRTYDLVQYSDEKIKKNIKTLNSSLEKLLLLKGYKYDLADYPGMPTPGEGDTAKVGLLAQEVMQIIPEVVELDTASNLYGIEYTALIPYLIEAIKEQQQQIEQLKNKVGFKSSNALVEGLEEQNTTASLSQNQPNPFNQETQISFYIPQDVQTANLYVYDLTGKQIKSINVVQREYGSVTIYANELNAGMYKYALVVNGSIVGTETMVLTD
ncbi:MAG: tail fiber domain-containing protein [Bacteroidales bacterium]|nr:tail fiber domain-containing protein [Bacteroidales bacterium]MBN2817797.1 tail fiber domain-containing protein [Bacteroidales bacterium]